MGPYGLTTEKYFSNELHHGSCLSSIAFQNINKWELLVQNYFHAMENYSQKRQHILVIYLHRNYRKKSFMNHTESCGRVWGYDWFMQSHGMDNIWVWLNRQLWEILSFLHSACRGDNFMIHSWSPSCQKPLYMKTFSHLPHALWVLRKLLTLKPKCQVLFF